MVHLGVYTVQGDMHGDSNHEEFPLMTLCEECVEKYHIDSEQNLKPGPCCEHCG
ncbi:hypothetical protein ACFFW8_09785 [Erwinia tracheiphila]